MAKKKHHPVGYCPACGNLRTLLRLRETLGLKPHDDVVKAIEELVKVRKAS